MRKVYSGWTIWKWGERASTVKIIAVLIDYNNSIGIEPCVVVCHLISFMLCRRIVDIMIAKVVIETMLKTIKLEKIVGN